MNENWQRVWQAKGAGRTASDVAEGDVLHGLMELDGYHSSTSSTSLVDHEVQFRYIRRALDIRATDSVYEVGCGAGALLYWLRPHCRAVGGADYASSLVTHARVALPGAVELRHCEARDISVRPQYDVVLSNGVFIYFGDQGYARDVLLLMIAKARRAVGVLDVNDADRKDEFEAMRRGSQSAQGADYAGLDQLYLPREFFDQIALEHGLACRIENSIMPNSVNARYRYHALLFK